MIMLITPGRIACFNLIASKNVAVNVKKAYVRYISHELRTPLSTVCMGLQLATEQIDDVEFSESEKKETLVEISQACELAVDVLNELLIFDKLEDGILSLTPQNIPAIDFILENIKLFAVQFREKNLNVTMQNTICRDQSLKGTIASSSIYPCDVIFIDKHKMGQVIRNLVSNAIKFTPHSGNVDISIKFVPNDIKFREEYVRQLSNSRQATTSHSILNSMRFAKNSITPTIENDIEHSRSSNQTSDFSSYKGIKNFFIETRKEIEHKLKCISVLKGYLEIKISDSGVGMKEEEMSRLFNEVVQFQPDILQDGGGSGLGLWISKGIVDLHKGQISVRSKGEGKGSTFKLEIPYCRTLESLSEHDGSKLKRVLYSTKSRSNRSFPKVMSGKSKSTKESVTSLPTEYDDYDTSDIIRKVEDTKDDEILLNQNTPTSFLSKNLKIGRTTSIISRSTFNSKEVNNLKKKLNIFNM